MTMTQQAEFCRALAERLAESVTIRDEALKTNKNIWVGGTITATQGAGITQIKSDITRLRRELQRLSEMVG